MRNKFKQLDLRQHSGRVFVVGDIHGAFSKLETALDELDFDWNTDVLLSVGDLVDRGPENERCIEFLEKPNFHAIQGNHEEFCYTLGGQGIHGHPANGGKWLRKLYYKDMVLHNTIKKSLYNLPILMEVLLPDGRKIALAHACYPSNDWNDAEKLANDREEPRTILWSRDYIRIAKDHHAFFPLDGKVRCKDIANVDHIYYGHTPLDSKLTVGNQSWIDTGAVFNSGYFTIDRVYPE